MERKEDENEERTKRNKGEKHILKLDHASRRDATHTMSRRGAKPNLKFKI